MTLAEARDELRALVSDGGAECPCCKRLAKVYKRRLNAGMAVSLIQFYRAHGRDYGFAPDLFGYGNEFARLHLWGLIAEKPERRDDGGRAGWWRITGYGEAFVLGQATAMSHALIYAARVLRFEGELITIQEALGQRFNYAELMMGHA